MPSRYRNPSTTERRILVGSIPARPMRSSVRAVSAKSVPASVWASSMTASIRAVGTPRCSIALALVKPAGITVGAATA
jgi:hypothetical protein